MKKITFALIFLLMGGRHAFADNCSAYPYTLTNGTTADANQVMANFNSVLSCGNNLLLGRNNNLSDLQSAATARTNLGLGNGVTLNTVGDGTGLQTTVSAVNGHLPAWDSTGGLVDSGLVAGGVLTQASNLSGLSNVATSRSNLGLGSIAVQNVTYSTSAPTGAANAGDLWISYVP